jgi:branched-chain amino acid transport system ATP-binding protein
MTVFRQACKPAERPLEQATMTNAIQPYLSVNNIDVIYDHVILVLKGVSLLVPKG